MNSKKDELMEEAKSLGLEPHHSTGELKLQAMINEALEPTVATEEEVKTVATVETKPERMQRLRNEQRKLIRVIVRCNNDNKKEWTGETHSVICAAGTIKKWVPFDNEKGWHVPQAILDVIGAKMCLKFRNSKLANGQTHKISYLTKEYNIEILKPLTKKQIEKLAEEQAARGSID